MERGHNGVPSVFVRFPVEVDNIHGQEHVPIRIHKMEVWTVVALQANFLHVTHKHAQQRLLDSMFR